MSVRRRSRMRETTGSEVGTEDGADEAPELAGVEDTLKLALPVSIPEVSPELIPELVVIAVVEAAEEAKTLEICPWDIEVMGEGGVCDGTTDVTVITEDAGMVFGGPDMVASSEMRLSRVSFADIVELVNAAAVATLTFQRAKTYPAFAYVLMRIATDRGERGGAP
jgi:hypothetical protein